MIWFFLGSDLLEWIWFTLNFLLIHELLYEIRRNRHAACWDFTGLIIYDFW